MAGVSIHLYWWQIGIAIASAITLYTNSTVAQITPDATLPNNSNVTIEGKTFNITGGSTTGGNLFHSFKDFSIPTGSSAFFNNDINIQNIISRVTGNSISNIDGLIKANGGANLFLINPNGIIFGQNARLDIGGSFLATSASSMKFTDGFEFSAVNSESKPLLTVTAPVGLQVGVNPGSIEVQGSTLLVQPGQTLALVGGFLSMDGGHLLTSGGHIELASVAVGTIELNKNELYLGLNFPGSIIGNLVSLSNGAELNVRSADKGSIAINAQNIDISGASTRVRAGISVNSGTPQSQAGDIDLNATETVKIRDGSIIANNTSGLGNAGAVRINAKDFVFLDGTSQIQSAVGAGSVGNASGIFISTGSLKVTNSASLNSLTLGVGNAGSVNINARDTVSFDSQTEATDASIIRSSVDQTAHGNGGDINITTGSLSLTRGSTFFSGVYGKGSAGNININARDTVTIDAENSIPLQNSGIRSNVFSGGEGNGGNININTGSLFVRNGGILNSDIQSAKGKLAGNININARDAVVFDGINQYHTSLALTNTESKQGVGGGIYITARSLSVKNNALLSAQTYGQGNGGNIAINTNTIDVLDGGQLSTTTFNSGKAGDITVKATYSVNLSGKGVSYITLLEQSDGTEYFGEQTQHTGLFANTDSTSTGEGGDIRITAQKLTIQNTAQMSVSSSGTGNAGSIEAIAPSISLLDGKIIADTTVGQGNINLRARDLILRRDSQITTNANGENIIGGNININADVLAAFEKSNISANSVDFRGGRVTINTQGIFGIEPWYTDAFRGYITASGANPQLSGTIQINTPDVEPSRGLIELPINLVDVSNQISNACTPGNPKFDSTFTVTGRGGLPISPEDLLQDVDTLTSWIRSENTTGASGSQPTQAQKSKIANPIVEATGWTADNQGQVYLVANARDTLSQYIPSQPNLCPN